jgi:hypothetical protein
MNLSLKTLTLTAVAALAACNPLDPYAARWREVAIGDTRAAVEQAMGSPSAVHTLEMPLVKLEQADWKAVTGRVYVVRFAMDRVVAKSVDN